ncbi:PREDICTED: uncharacterized protein LOC18605688 [Theobroma cacao]|uniref:Uncharacterized protein LOC18605688 n=1 Tax=Theobroma cacao TaxID=3641 RepID=A0AB32W295_THECC|nr:PREDICTED: uncharacterized protein LOC18605688 [Theobroma cacao]
MGAPPPAFTIRHPDYAISDNVTPFRDYDYFGALWDPVPFFSSKQTSEEWTTNELITFEQLEEYGAYYVGERSDMYAVSHFVYYVDGEYMPVFRKITGYDMFTYCRRRIMRRENRRGYATPRAFPKPVCLNPPANSQEQPKRQDTVINVGSLKINPNPNPTNINNMEKGMNGEDEEEACCWDEIIEDYFSDKASSSESDPGFDTK